MKKQRLILVTLLILLIIVSIKLFFDFKNQSEETDFKSLVARYPYLARRILIENPNDVLVSFVDLRKQLKEYIAPFGDSFTFYFEYLPTGVSIGVNEKTEFYGASLVKVPLAMAFLNFYRSQGLDLNEKVKIKKEEINRGFGDLWKSGEGTEISLKDALALALTESDNTAAEILRNRVPLQYLSDVYDNLDLDMNADQDQVILTTKGYSSILKALYFSSILNKEDSQYILKLLTASKFTDKLAAPIPKEIPVAHKAGVYFDSVYQDCGIVYVPERPYLLCMASQSKEQETNERMKKLSEIIYQYITQVNHQ